MDDPWGSPWTTTDAETPFKRAPSPSKSDLEPPPRAFLSANSSPRLPATAAVSHQSPWADGDDGFGDWTSANTAAEAAQSTSAWAGWHGSAASTSRERLGPRSRDNSFILTSPITPPSNTAPSPGTRQHSNSLFRQLSPDPWASDLRLEEPDSDPARQPTPRLIVDEPALSPTKGSHAAAPLVFDEPDAIWNSAFDRPTTQQSVSPSKSRPAGLPEEPASPPSPTAPNYSVSGPPLGGIPPALRGVNRSARSRSSSPSRNNSDHDPGRQDSPLTPIDDDAKPRPQPTLRKTSGKVQELVYKFDGLAKSTVEDPTPARREREPTPAGRTDSTGGVSDANGDFGDFEDADSATPVPAPEPASPTASVPVSPKAPNPVSVSFTIDTKLVDSLYQDEDLGELDLEVSAADAPVSDRIIRDSFTTISERKVWYRISRQGSSRKHDAGDDDSYCRVMWGPSTVRKEVLGIVRRWMEEDSIAGRTNLRGHIGGGNVFGWDSDADPAALDKVFGKKKKDPPHSRKSSLQHVASMSPAASSSASPHGPARDSPLGSKPLFASPAATFGWSTASSPPPAIPDQPILPGAQMKRPPAQTSKPQPSNPQPFEERSLPPLDTTVPPAVPVNDDDDDEWGEMISSPQVGLDPAPTNGLIPLDPIFSESPPPQTPKPKPTPPKESQPGTSGPPANYVGHPTPAVPAQTSAHARSSSTWSRSKAFADLSVLEPTANSSTAKIITKPSPSNQIQTPTTPSTVSSNAKSVEVPARLSGRATPGKRESDESENDRLAREIIDNLPDLSYMLR